jgi:RHS repeat-associated protein
MDYRFTGQKKDASGLYYYNARYYSPDLGQFISPDTLVPDPSNVQDYNRYMYVRGNPMNAVDPSGYFCVPVVNMGTTCQGSTDWDAVQSSLDVAGVADPTPISDGVNAVISVARGNYMDAGLSAVAIVPYIGDLAKGGKYLDEAAAGARWVGDKADEGWQAAKRWTDCLINSFSAKTLVMTPSGLKAISELVEGELVLAYNEATGEIGAYPITDVISHLDPEIVLLTIDGQTLETTAEHPFYVVEANEWSPYLSAGKWIDAGDLQVGDDVRQADGSTGEVRSVRVVAVAQPMYNLTVDTAHTFFVGHGQWLVHNVDCVGGRKPINSHYADSLYELTDPTLNAKYPGGVRFTEDGFPDFSLYATYEVEIDMIGNTTTDFSAANKAAGLMSTPRGYTWHHHQDGKTMLLVPSDLHNAVRHTGGVAVKKAGR